MDIKVSPGTRLFLATPCYNGQLHAAFVYSLLRTSNMLLQAGIRHTPRFFAGASYVPISRNILVAQFMATESTHLMFLDSDVEWEPSAVGRLLAAAQLPDMGVCCGVYPRKCTPVAWPCNFVSDAERNVSRHPDTGYIELLDAPTGFMMIRREVIEKMMAAYPERKCRFREDSPEAEKDFEYSLFDCYISEYQGVPWYLSEDFGFCRLWQRIGGRVWADPEIKIAHHGQKKYEGDFSSVIEAE